MAIGAYRLGPLLREPLLHFLILGGLIFWFLSDPSTPGSVEADDRIVISSADVERMALAWTQRWQRPPSEDDLSGLIREAVREQVLYRESLALGLEQDDVVIRRLLRQKYEFLTQDLAYDTDPDEATLRAFYEADPDRYREAARLSFSHILFSPDRRGSSTEADAALTLADLQLATGPQMAETLGDATSLPSDIEDLDERQVAAMFGPNFTSALLDLEPERWAGPLTSGYGLHLVWVSGRVPGSRRAFEEVRQRVKDDWIYTQRVAANEAVYRKLLERYEVVVEPVASQPEGGGGGS